MGVGEALGRRRPADGFVGWSKGRGEPVSESVSGVKGRHSAHPTPAADDTNSRFDNILPELGLNRAATPDQQSPRSLPGGATRSAAGDEPVALCVSGSDGTCHVSLLTLT
jgi:hypothetical protein